VCVCVCVQATAYGCSTRAHRHACTRAQLCPRAPATRARRDFDFASQKKMDMLVNMNMHEDAVIIIDAVGTILMTSNVGGRQGGSGGRACPAARCRHRRVRYRALGQTYCPHVFLVPRTHSDPRGVRKRVWDRHPGAGMCDVPVQQCALLYARTCARSTRSCGCVCPYQHAHNAP